MDGNSGFQKGSISEGTPDRIITVSLTCIIESLTDLRVARHKHDTYVQGMVDVLAIVTSAARGQVEKEKLTRNTGYQMNESQEGKPESSEGLLNNRMILRTSYTKQDSFLSSKKGSPFRENIIHQTISTKNISENSPVNNLLHETVSSFLDSVSQTSTSSIDPSVLYRINSADFESNSNESPRLQSISILRERVERDKDNIKNIQKKIRIAAETDDLELMNSLILERTNIAVQSIDAARSLYDHISSLKDSYKLKETHLYKMKIEMDNLIINRFNVNNID